jgi:hypothetical protein
MSDERGFLRAILQRLSDASQKGRRNRRNVSVQQVERHPKGAADEEQEHHHQPDVHTT